MLAAASVAMVFVIVLVIIVFGMIYVIKRQFPKDKETKE